MAEKSDIKAQHQLLDLDENSRSLCLTIDDLLLNKTDYPHSFFFELILKSFVTELRVHEFNLRLLLILLSYRPSNN